MHLLRWDRRALMALTLLDSATPCAQDVVTPWATSWAVASPWRQKGPASSS